MDEAPATADGDHIAGREGVCVVDDAAVRGAMYHAGGVL